jgi:hypothetical protein
MSRRRVSGPLGALLAALLPLPAAAAESPLDQVPATAPVVVYVRGVRRVKDRLVEALHNAMPGKEGRQFADQVGRQLDDALRGKQFDGRALQGVDDDAPAFLALLELPASPDDLPQSAALFVNVKNYADFRDGLLTEDERKDLEKRDGYESTVVARQSVYFVRRGDYAVVALRRDLAEQLTKKQPGLGGKLGADAARRLLAADAAVYLDAPAVGKQYGEQLLEFRQVAEKGLLRELKDNDLEAVAPAVKVMLGGVVQFFKDAREGLLTAEVRPEGLLLHAEVRVGDDTKTNSYLEKEKPSALDEVGDLPAGEASFTAFHPAAGGLVRPLVRALTGALPAGEADALRDAARAEEEAKTTLVLGAHADRTGAEGLEVYFAADPAKLAEARLKMYQAVGAGSPLIEAVLKDKPEVETEAQKYRGFALHSVRLTYDLDRTAKLMRADAAALRKQMGGDESQAWFGTDGKVYVEVKGKNWRAARRSLDAYLDRKDDAVGSRKGFKAARARLPEQASFLYIEETTLYTQAMLDGLAASGSGPARRAPRAAAGDEAYYGLALTLQAGRVAADLWVPVEVFKDYMKAVAGVKEEEVLQIEK